MPKTVKRCPHCKTSIHDGHFNELVAKAVRVVPMIPAGDVDYVLGKTVNHNVNHNFRTKTYYCETCDNTFKEFEEGDINDTV